MKQEIINYLLSIEEDIYKISKFLYENPEESFCEHKAYNYLTSILKDNNFNIQESFLDISTAFMAQFGEGHPKICYICEYDCSCKQGHILGTNLVSSMAIGAALGLSKVIPKIGGSVVVIGCPGEFLSGSKVTMTKQGVFEDMDAILMAQPSIINANCCTSPAVLPIEITYKCNDESCFKVSNGFSAFDASLFTLNSINTILKGYPKECSIDKISINGDLVPHILTKNIQTCFSIKAPSLAIAEEIKNKITSFTTILNELMGVSSEVTLSQVPYEDFKANSTLCRIFSHNLKEVGIIDIADEINLPYGLSLGNVSHMVPTLRYLVQITDDKSIEYACQAFGKATMSPFARDKVLDTVKALANTGLDLIQQQNLLSEAKSELHK